jgi:cytochrome bd-type quinol oxidase subunit 2
MPDRISARRDIDNAEAVREARELAWISCLLIVLSPTAYIFYLMAEQSSLNSTETILLVVLPILLAVRLVTVALQQGRKLNDHAFLMRMDSWACSFLYLGARLCGFAAKRP